MKLGVMAAMFSGRGLAGEGGGAIGDIDEGADQNIDGGSCSEVHQPVFL